jgi:hypothetical protein
MANEFKHKDPGSELTQAEFIASDGTGHIFDGQAAGDVLYASSTTVLKNLAKATDGNVLELASGLPAWTGSPNLTALTVDDVAIDGKVITMTGSSGDTAVFTVGTNGTLSLVTVDTAASAANIQITADGTLDIDSAGVLTLDSGAAINIEPAAGSAVLIDGNVSIDGDAVTGIATLAASGVITAGGFTIGSAAITEAELEILDGATVTTAELNVLDALDRGSILYGNASSVTTVLGQGTADQVLTSDGTDISWETAGGVSHQVLRKSSDESVTSSTTLQNDDDFTFSIGANEVWVVQLYLFTTGVDTGGLKHSWSLPSGGSFAFGNITWIQHNAGGAVSSSSGKETSVGVVQDASSSTVVKAAIVTAILKNSSTSGTAVWQWAQHASNGTATTINADSTMIAHKV